MSKILVCGGRTYADYQKLREELEQHRPGEEGLFVIHGGATGADALAGKWAFAVGAQPVVCPANWRRYGGAAGPIRNQNMLDLHPDLVIAFPGQAGTADMIGRARQGGFEIKEIR